MADQAPKADSVSHVSLCATVDDFQPAAKSVLSEKSYVYVSSSANSGLSLKANLDDWSRITFRPRILRNATRTDTRSSILGHATDYPFYVSAMGTLKIAHPKAEPLLVEGATRSGLHTVVSTASSRPLEEIAESWREAKRRTGNASPSKLFFQMYVSPDREKAKALLRRVRAAGFEGLWITVDTGVLGKRLADRYLQAREALEVDTPIQPVLDADNSFSPAYGGRAGVGAFDESLSWADLAWVRQEWDKPIVIKGVQSVEDVKLAVQHGLDGVLLSNHGGRQLPSAPSALMTLLETRLYYPEAFDKLEIYVDGGLRDGSDVLKALCLGAKSVGVGRPYFYAMAAYGEAGVQRCTDILAEEFTIGMKLLGVSSVDELTPEMVNVSQLLGRVYKPLPKL